MKEKVFYTLFRSGYIIHVVKQDGFQFVKSGILLYIYQEENGFCHVIDPLTGMSIYGGFFDIEYVDLFLTDDEIDSFVEKKETKEYEMLKSMFASYKKAEILKSKYIKFKNDSK